MCLNTGTPKNINFSFQTNGKLMALGVPVLKHFRVTENGYHTCIRIRKDKAVKGKGLGLPYCVPRIKWPLGFYLFISLGERDSNN